MGTPEWPGDTPYSCGWTASISDGSSVNLSSMTTSPHVGTHADAPVHVRDGWPGAHELPLEAFLRSGRSSRCNRNRRRAELRADRACDRSASARASDPQDELRNRWRSFPRTVADSLRIVRANSPRPRISDSSASTVLQWTPRRASHSLFTKCFSPGNAFILENLDLRRTPPVLTS